MPNHFHLVLQPDRDGALSSYLHWVSGRYACHVRASTNTLGQGHVFQRRFWSDVIHDETHFWSVLRYVEANAGRAQLVPRAEQWCWSSLALRPQADGLLDELPAALPDGWVTLVNEPQSERLLADIRPRDLRGRRPARAPDRLPLR